MHAAFIARRLATETPFLHEGVLAAWLNLTTAEPLPPQAAEHPALKGMRERLRPSVERVGDTAVVPVSGALARRPDPIEMAYGEIEDTDVIRGLVGQAAADPEVRSMVLDVDSPGGFYGGGPELADAIRTASASKPVVAWTGGMMASLAYWVGSQADQVVASRSASVGSIGVYIAAYDLTRLYESVGIKVELFKNREGDLKAMGVPGTSLTEAQRGHLQEQAQSCFNEFKAAVRSRRGDLPEEAMRGQTFTGQEARRMKLVDRVGDRNFAISVARSLARARGRS